MEMTKVNPLLRTGFQSKQVRVAAFAATIAAALAVRFWMFPFIGGDMYHDFLVWYNTIVQQGGWIALREPFYSYSSPYLYLLVFASYLRGIFPAVVAIKLVSVGFDFIAAILVYRLLRIKYPQGNLPWAAFCAALFAPTVLVDSALWGQCDVIYTAFLLASIFFACKQKYGISVICLSVAFSFKAQALFLGPLIALLFIKRLIPWRAALLFPLTYGLMILPVILVGRPVNEAFGVYLDQVGSFHRLSMNAPTLYAFISNQYYDIAFPAGLLLAALIGLGMIWVAARDRSPLDAEKTLVFATVSLTLMPFFLPKMHERYFFPAALAAIGLAFFRPKLRLIPIFLQAVSLIGYLSFLLDQTVIPLWALALVMAVLVSILGAELLRTFIPGRRARQEPASSTA